MVYNMSYVRRYKKNNKNPRKSVSWYNRRYSTLDLAKKAWSATKYIKSLINVETKFFDVTQTGLSISSSGSIYPLSQIAGGSAYNQRDGNSVKAVSNLCRLSAVLNSPAESVFIRCIIFTDAEQRASTPAVSDVLESVGYLSPINHINGSRFQVVSDTLLVLKKDMNAISKKYFRKLNSHIKFSSATSTDTKEGNFYMLLLSDQATNVPTVNFLNRLRYVDN